MPSGRNESRFGALTSMILWATPYEEFAETHASFAARYAIDISSIIAWDETESNWVDQALSAG